MTSAFYDCYDYGEFKEMKTYHGNGRFSTRVEFVADDYEHTPCFDGSDEEPCVMSGPKIREKRSKRISKIKKEQRAKKQSLRSTFHRHEEVAMWKPQEELSDLDMCWFWHSVELRRYGYEDDVKPCKICYKCRGIQPAFVSTGWEEEVLMSVR